MNYNSNTKAITIDNSDDYKVLLHEPNISIILNSVLESEADAAILQETAVGEDVVKLRIIQNTIQIQKAILKMISNK